MAKEYYAAESPTYNDAKIRQWKFDAKRNVLEQLQNLQMTYEGSTNPKSNGEIVTLIKDKTLGQVPPNIRHAMDAKENKYRYVHGNKQMGIHPFSKYLQKELLKLNPSLAQASVVDEIQAYPDFNMESEDQGDQSYFGDRVGNDRSPDPIENTLARIEAAMTHLAANQKPTMNKRGDRRNEPRTPASQAGVSGQGETHSDLQPSLQTLLAKINSMDAKLTAGRSKKAPKQPTPQPKSESPRNTSDSDSDLKPSLKALFAKINSMDAKMEAVRSQPTASQAPLPMIEDSRAADKTDKPFRSDNYRNNQSTARYDQPPRDNGFRFGRNNYGNGGQDRRQFRSNNGQNGNFSNGYNQERSGNGGYNNNRGYNNNFEGPRDGTPIKWGTRDFVEAENSNSFAAFNPSRPTGAQKQPFTWQEGYVIPNDSIPKLSKDIDVFQYQGKRPRISKTVLDFFRNRCPICGMIHDTAHGSCPYHKQGPSWVPCNKCHGRAFHTECLFSPDWVEAEEKKIKNATRD